nr:hypothetical protein GCM10020241_52990 [Streptoalloteichus tenebrarius]
MTSGLAEAWERYWHDLPTTPGAAPWDGDATAHVAEHVPLFEPYFERDLPLLDIGCGNGRQTLFLGTCFPRVIGLDVSESAVERARAGYVPDNVEFRRLDLLDTAAVADLSAELGDANVYMRAVLHQLPPESKLAAAANLARLLGERGHVFALELTPEGRRPSRLRGGRGGGNSQGEAGDGVRDRRRAVVRPERASPAGGGGPAPAGDGTGHAAHDRPAGGRQPVGPSRRVRRGHPRLGRRCLFGG